MPITDPRQAHAYRGEVVIDKEISTSARVRVPARTIPQASLRRLPQYHHFLVELQQTGVKQVSCSVIGLALDCIPVQVRKDLQYTGIVGRPKTGYCVRELIRSIETYLGWDNVHEAFLAGVGNMGTALLRHERFSSFGLKIVAAFDTDPHKTGSTICGIPVLPSDRLAGLCHTMNVRLGIITTPARVAQLVADEMVRGGILAIWNFSPVRLQAPPSVSIHNEDLYSSLASLSWSLARRLHDTAATAPPPSEHRGIPAVGPSLNRRL